MTNPLYRTEFELAPRRGVIESSMDFRARLAIESEERAERKRQELEQLRSEGSTPRERVLAWEKAHGLRMPGDSAHPILLVIAQATRLTLREVLEEQRARAVKS